MHVHILGIGGTFMAGVALLARAAGHEVTGSDEGLYPPMSTQLAEAGIAVMDGYQPAHLEPAPDQVVVGNAMARGNPAIEYMLDAGLAYTSGPQWLADHVLADRWVLAVAGTHGKTTTASMLAHILLDQGAAPGWLIGGIAADLGASAAFGESRFFVVEADEYDTAFFDKRSKFVHYRPRTLILNNLEFDHADIFDDLAAIQRQFHHLLRTVPGAGRIVHNAADAALDTVIAQGCWTPRVGFNRPDGWHAEPVTADHGRLRIGRGDQFVGELAWTLKGAHNAANACAAIAAAEHAGIAPSAALAALATFSGVKRRLELRGTPGGIAVYDDFAHHPTAIRATLDGLAVGRERGRVIVAFEPRSNTMRAGVHQATLGASFDRADRVYAYDAGIDWDLRAAMAALDDRFQALGDIDALVAAIAAEARPGDIVVVMSNGGFGGIHDKLLATLA
ncbi:UDP-N-acetylmuramate:L-alanyl-gamma-D-glutamyl-meso-diaminopimelate ligase [Salinisphaera sp.]|uniref:UDP-N-acetylmuramate:L-alanyl-gamma-D-glutamyl- meso-diaminopimelate ligase n=1 Tax=Salinisphaera sp. TaxID=1914330 RepID=UPI002D76C5DF|nr:UDP-N-acetylmuramate:L-alanyl-gamma-D-glutamyl-meso-diaminopimelate ligase [Salinisphaera sp.]HET7314897.1 UDP-N-acetylmuramate:L-alanyl-gamma-D-glutamyl-meso-diaminopimelate ligase [Salinisphaera sp.]